MTDNLTPTMVSNSDDTDFVALPSPASEALAEHSCRFCGSQDLHSFVDLGMSPLCESFVKREHLNRLEAFFPLHAFVCADCFLVQVPTLVSGEEIFGGEYAYFSSYSDSWLRHAAAYVDMITDRLELNKQSQVVEVASNDGYLLKNFVAKGIPALGIEPADNVAAVAIEKGVPSLVRFFGVETANDLVTEGTQADLLLGNNVLAHVPDVNDFVGGFKILLREGGVITNEFPHLMCLVEQNQFDTIYQEHYCYFSLLAAQTIFAKHGLTIFDVEEIPTHGGSLRIYSRHTEDESKPVTRAVQDLIERELAAGYGQFCTF